jgi:hypothetical protein
LEIEDFRQENKIDIDKISKRPNKIMREIDDLGEEEFEANTGLKEAITDAKLLHPQSGFAKFW